MVENLNQAKERLVEVQHNYQKQQLINLKAPFTGVISQVNQITNQLSAKEQTIIELVNCHNLWVEVMVDANLLAEIDLQQLALLNFDDSHLSSSGTISSIQPVQIIPQDYVENYLENTSTILPNLETDLTENYLNPQAFYKIKIDFLMPDNYAQQYKLCGLVEPAIVTFNSEN